MRMKQKGKKKKKRGGSQDRTRTKKITPRGYLSDWVTVHDKGAHGSRRGVNSPSRSLAKRGPRVVNRSYRQFVIRQLRPILGTTRGANLSSRPFLA